MAAMLFRGLKGINLSCTSPASTAICSTVDHRPPLHGRSLQHLHSKFTNSPPTSPTPQTQVPHLISPASSSRYLLNEDFNDLFDADSIPSFWIPSTTTVDGSTSSSSTSSSHELKKLPCEGHVNYLRSAKGSSSFHGGDGGTSWVRFHTVDGGESAALSRPPRTDPLEKMGAPKGSSCSPVKGTLGVGNGDKCAVLKSASATTRNQVVVLRVSLHCKGCEGKVRKHISRMPGVSSFSIDFASKKVTVISDVTPLGVLSSISKVKNAQLWPSSPPHLPTFC